MGIRNHWPDKTKKPARGLAFLIERLLLLAPVDEPALNGPPKAASASRYG
jgi:hypothetical protein